MKLRHLTELNTLESYLQTRLKQQIVLKIQIDNAEMSL